MTTNKALTLPTYNQTSPTWDQPLNANFTNIDQALGGVQSFNLGSASGTIAVTGTIYAGSYPSNTASYVPLTWALSGALAGNVTLQIPSGVGGQWIVENATSGAFTVTVSNAAAGTTVNIPQGITRSIFSDGTNINFSDQQTSSAGTTTQVIFNSGGSLTGSANLTFNGTTLAPNALAVTNNATVGGTLGVTGNATVIGTLGVTGTLTANGTSSSFGLDVTNAAEIATVSATAATGTINFYVGTQSILYYTSAATANWTLNFAFSAGTALGSALPIGQTVTVVFMATQGATPYYANAFQIDGTPVTPKWQGGSAPAAGDASSVDVYSFSIIQTSGGIYTVLASLTQFK